MKNAIDYLFAEWNDKAAGLVGYGVQGRIRAVEALRLVLAEVKIATVRTQVCVNLKSDFVLDGPTDVGRISPAPHQEDVVRRMFDEVAAWAEAPRVAGPGMRPDSAAHPSGPGSRTSAG